ncbi:MAG TPA: HD domain-containing protein [Synergistaceae bacterium]|nr:HD domain-containing protein [Synergistaceae bacterium]HPQ37116.1 HD domain-containing protein [Synergistaceae bacterium]
MQFDKEEVCRWFHAYVASYYERFGKIHQLVLKEEHSHRVAAYCAAVSEELHWSEEEQRLAFAVGLLHDIGRFPQYGEYGTFFDFRSVDHGERGLRVLREEMPGNLFLSRGERILEACVSLHNKKDIPENLSGEILPYLQIVRDCDKVDIFHVVREHVDAGRSEELYPGLRPEGSYSDRVVADLVRENKARYDTLRTLSDVMLFQLCWIFDITYPAALRLLLRNGEIQWILGRLPEDSRIEPLLQRVREKIVPFSEECKRETSSCEAS